MSESPESEGVGTFGPALYRLTQAVAVVLAAFAGAVAVAGGGIGVLISGGIVEPETIGYHLALTVLQFVGFGVGIVGYVAITDDRELISYRLPTRFGWGLIGVGIVVLLIVQFAFGFVLSEFGLEAGENQVVLIGRENPQFFLYMILVSILVVGPVEELLFRGVVQGLLRRAVSAWPAIVLAAAFFGLVHVWAVQGTIGQQLVYAVVATVLGIVLGYLYERTGNIVVPGLAHGLYNAVLFAIQYVAVTRAFI
ncbi:Metal-dependent membrane protease, CAAX family [Halalkaliarchaeum sp. AArc-CO]|uniref:CPBP family intramembrane glutamic endopeptidase n=1 Tax=Halalkaliarchaeum sp. AArc-CO TaxID=2866381 RepID=UPI00217EC284|nr:CPBP family intramembrane glutamic endopeptidase [Halalkaliarchaeum sp. AArc-CO]UWG50211.1 Metal-dependent membrane protease, CAAX family [Halalkaliarchaeum sp. AArc-CO]